MSVSLSGGPLWLQRRPHARSGRPPRRRETRVRRLQGRGGGRIRLQGRARLARGRGAAPPRWWLAPVPPLGEMDEPE